MEKHYNLYYLFLEEMRKHPLPEARSRQIRQNIENFYKQEKPPDKAKLYPQPIIMKVKN